MDIMSAQTTYVYRLNCDLLLHIFEMNADMFNDDDALLSTRCASQVCRGWRSLLLRTSWIWARLVDLDWPYFRATPPPEWLAELLQRTGSAPLWVKARHALSQLRNSPPHISRFIFAVLTINWHRVERLALSVEDLDWSVQRIKNMWGWVYTPAPQLKEFDVSFGTLQWDHPPSVPLFAGNAPALRSMVSDHHPIDLYASWLHNLRVLEIDVPFTPAQAITALQSAPKLEDLTVNEMSSSEADSISYPVNLPNLRSLNIMTPLQQCSFLLNHIHAPPSCSFKYYKGGSTIDSAGSYAYITVIRLLGSFARRHLPTAAPTKLELFSSSQSLRLNYSGISRSQDFRLAILSSYDPIPNLPSDLTRTTFSAFARSGFASVTDLLLRFPTERDLVEHLKKFLEHLTAVETLATGEGEFKLIVQVQENLAAGDDGPEEIFPRIKAIVLAEREYADYSSLETDSDSAIRSFVAARRATGRVVEVRDGGNVFRHYR